MISLNIVIGMAVVNLFLPLVLYMVYIQWPNKTLQKTILISIFLEIFVFVWLVGSRSSLSLDHSVVYPIQTITGEDGRTKQIVILPDGEIDVYKTFGYFYSEDWQVRVDYLEKQNMGISGFNFKEYHIERKNGYN